MLALDILRSPTDLPRTIALSTTQSFSPPSQKPQLVKIDRTRTATDLLPPCIVIRKLIAESFHQCLPHVLISALCRFASALASLLDLNTLHNLSLTSRLFHTILLDNRDQLVRRSLRCINDPYPGETINRPSSSRFSPRYSSSRFGQCARDMVAECRRCGTVVCRVL